MCCIFLYENGTWNVTVVSHKTKVIQVTLISVPREAITDSHNPFTHLHMALLQFPVWFK